MQEPLVRSCFLESLRGKMASVTWGDTLSEGKVGLRTQNMLLGPRPRPLTTQIDVFGVWRDGKALPVDGDASWRRIGTCLSQLPGQKRESRDGLEAISLEAIVLGCFELPLLHCNGCPCRRHTFPSSIQLLECLAWQVPCMGMEGGGARWILLMFH